MEKYERIYQIAGDIIFVPVWLSPSSVPIIYWQSLLPSLIFPAEVIWCHSIRNPSLGWKSIFPLCVYVVRKLLQLTLTILLPAAVRPKIGTGKIIIIYHFMKIYYNSFGRISTTNSISAIRPAIGEAIRSGQFAHSIGEVIFITRSLEKWPSRKTTKLSLVNYAFDYFLVPTKH